MGNGFMSRPSSADSVSWGRVEAREDKDEDLFQPIRNYSGEIVDWKERCVSSRVMVSLCRYSWAILLQNIRRIEISIPC